MQPRFVNEIYRASGALFEIIKDSVLGTLSRTLKEGDVVTIEHDHFIRLRGEGWLPSSPKITRIREDVRWEDAVYDFVSQKMGFSGNCAHTKLLLLTYSFRFPNKITKTQQILD